MHAFSSVHDQYCVVYRVGWHWSINKEEPWTFFSCSLAGHGVANQMQRWSMLWDFYATMPIAVRTKCFVHCIIHVKMALACMYIFLNNMSKILLQKLTVKPTPWCRAVILGSFKFSIVCQRRCCCQQYCLLSVYHVATHICIYIFAIKSWT